ncbi:hypothetical protein ABGB16_31225 [Micromonospora sp. B11E3]
MMVLLRMLVPGELGRKMRSTHTASMVPSMTVIDAEQYAHYGKEEGECG